MTEQASITVRLNNPAFLIKVIYDNPTIGTRHYPELMEKLSKELSERAEEIVVEFLKDKYNEEPF